MIQVYRPESMDDDDEPVPSLEIPDSYGQDEDDLNLEIPSLGLPPSIVPPCVWVRSILTEPEVLSLIQPRSESGEVLEMWFTPSDSPTLRSVGQRNITFNMLLEMSFLGIDATLELPGNVSKSLTDPEVMEKFILGSE